MVAVYSHRTGSGFSIHRCQRHTAWKQSLHTDNVSFDPTNFSALPFTIKSKQIITRL